MRPPDRYSVSPLPSYCVVPTRRAPSFAEMVKAVWRWFTGTQPRPTMRERQLEAAVIERLVEEMAADDETSLVRQNAGETSLKSHGAKA